MFAMLAALAAPASDPAPTECSYDVELELSRDAVAFDQTEGQGWRPLYDARCYLEAAELLGAWRMHNAHTLDLANPRDSNLARIILWHEAQMWAFGGRADAALPIFEATYRDSDEEYARAWNLYVDGTLAFLRRDRNALGAVIAQLSMVPRPPGLDSAVGMDGQPITISWPQNLDVLEGLERCWDQPYAAAYLCRDFGAQR